MAESQKRKMGRPAVNATPITVRVPPALLADLDAHISSLDEDPKPSRPEVIRRILNAQLASPPSDD